MGHGAMVQLMYKSSAISLRLQYMSHIPTKATLILANDPSIAHINRLYHEYSFARTLFGSFPCDCIGGWCKLLKCSNALHLLPMNKCTR